MKYYILIFSIFIIYFSNYAETCSSFYCINSCGASKTNKGFKLILANNRDEDIFRPTLPAGPWPAKISQPSFNKFSSDLKVCDQSKLDPPFNLCVYGALDIARAAPPNYYSTWLAINERGSVGNLLFYMQQPVNITMNEKNRGIITGNFLQNSSWANSEEYLQLLSDSKKNYKPFNYVQLEMSEKTGAYSMYYLNNNNSLPYQKLNNDETKAFIFSLSNSDLNQPFQKVKFGKENFINIINNYTQNLDKQKLVNNLINDLLLDKKQYYPDDLLKKYMRIDDEETVKGVSQINADYGSYWKNAYSRTSTVILVDYDDNVEYYEYNLTEWQKNENLKEILSPKWEMNAFKFKLKPLYKNSSRKNNLSFSTFKLTFIMYLFKLIKFH